MSTKLWRNVLVSALLALVAGAVVVELWRQRARPAGNLPAAPVTSNAAAASPIAAKPHVATESRGGSGDLLARTLAKLQAGGKGLAARPDLDQLRRALLSAPPADAVAAIRSFLDGKTDAPTGLGFKVGAKGLLNDAPTLRVFLLDCLSRVDPAAAADYARVILGSMDSPDEWAVALRSLAVGDPSADGRQFLEQKLGQMLSNQAWQQNPSAGFLEAFDTAVYLGGTDFVSALSALVRLQDNPAVAHAAYLTLDRLAINEPAALLGALEADPSLMQGREQTRANYFARADVRDPQQRQVLENYLLNPSIGAPELAQFAGLFPNANYMISQNLLTPNPTPDHAALVGRDAASLAAVEQWLADPRFANLQPQLAQTRLRLQQFVQQETGK
jgi:hypothetical protein